MLPRRGESPVPQWGHTAPSQRPQACRWPAAEQGRWAKIIDDPDACRTQDRLGASGARRAQTGAGDRRVLLPRRPARRSVRALPRRFAIPDAGAALPDRGDRVPTDHEPCRTEYA